MGAVFNPIGVALAAGAGAAIGELAGYLIGYSGQGVSRERKIYQKSALLDGSPPAFELSGYFFVGVYTQPIYLTSLEWRLVP